MQPLCFVYIINLMPLKDITTHRGIAKGSNFTTSTLLASRKDEQILEDSGSIV